MPFRAGLLLCLAVLFAAGCRDPLVPNVDLNKAPETWITAAPQDTITSRNGGTLVPPQIGTIPVRFHMYWAGSDADGAVAGFYWAVVETIPIPPPGLPLPPLPGPKPQDYRYTTKTDSTFIFTVSESAPDRQHAFFIYAVDNKGKPDPTPARVIFNALDRFPPIPIIELNGGAVGQGKVYTLLQSGMIYERDTTIFIRDSLTLDNFFQPPKDTVPVSSRLDFKWRAEPTIAGTYVTGYRYKLDEPDFVNVDTSTTTASYNTGIGGDVVTPGVKVFSLRAVDQAGGAREINRRFHLNFAPDTWFAGPDTNQAVYQTADRGNGKVDRYYDVTNWTSLPQFMGSLLSCDSLQSWPAERKPSKTFFEIYKNRLYVRSEFDTVHLNSWVLFFGGGSDKDSPYGVLSTDLDRTTDTLVCGPSKTLRPGPANGSPIGFHAFFGTQVEYGAYSAPVQSTIIPVFDATSSFRAPRIGAYREMRRAGKVYAVLRADDGQGLFDNRIGSRADRLVSRVDAGTGTPQDEALRSRVLTYYVGKAPYLLTGEPSFSPKVGQVFQTRQLNLNLLADDEDPYDLDTAPPNTGGPSTNKIFRYTVRVKGLAANGDTITTGTTPAQAFGRDVTVNLPTEVVAGPLVIEIELCDCVSCESLTGTGRCVTYVIPAVFQPPTSREASGTAGGENANDRGNASKGLKP